MNDQLECHRSQKERKCQNSRPDPHNMEPLGAIDQLLPILWWRAELPVSRGTVDRDGAHDPDQDPDAHGEHCRTPKPKAGSPPLRTVRAIPNTAVGAKKAGTSTRNLITSA